MTLSWTIADWSNNRHLLEIMGDSKRGKQRSDIGGVTQANQLRKLRVKRPNLELDPLVGDISPQLALDRHQTKLVRFFLQLTPTIGVVSAIQDFLPCNGEVNRMACLSHSVECREGEISRQLSSGFELGACQVERPGVIALPQHTLRFTSQPAA